MTESEYSVELSNLHFTYCGPGEALARAIFLRSPIH